jgi:hypothetical protein
MALEILAELDLRNAPILSELVPRNLAGLELPRDDLRMETQDVRDFGGGKETQSRGKRSGNRSLLGGKFDGHRLNSKVL